MAEYVEQHYATHGGRDLGPRSRCDGAGGLRVDFIYEAASPSAAMEMTALTQPAVKALNAEPAHLEDQFNQLAAFPSTCKPPARVSPHDSPADQHRSTLDSS